MALQVPSGITVDLKERLSIDIAGFSFVGGGCINYAGKISTSKGPFFLKWNSAHKFPAMLEAEAKGLRLLKKAKAIKVPEVIMQSTAGDYQYLLLEYIETSDRRNGFWDLFGEQLAMLHRESADRFGLNYDNYIGSLPQSNTPALDWTDFFITERLEPQLALVIDKKLADLTLQRKFQKLFKIFDSLIIAERPSLLHGDLWVGNLMVGRNGAPFLVDPAVYYGNREVDLAMASLFGGFDSQYLQKYQEVFPLENGFRERMEIYTIYPLLVHVNLFGKSYLPQLATIIDRFV
jgi:protein-ribulosamine 3-kinase